MLKYVQVWLHSKSADLTISDQDLKAHCFLNRTSPATAMEKLYQETDGM